MSVYPQRVGLGAKTPFFLIRSVCRQRTTKVFCNFVILYLSNAWQKHSSNDEIQSSRYPKYFHLNSSCLVTLNSFVACNRWIKIHYIIMLSRAFILYSITAITTTCQHLTVIAINLIDFIFDAIRYSQLKEKRKSKLILPIKQTFDKENHRII